MLGDYGFRAIFSVSIGFGLCSMCFVVVVCGVVWLSVCISGGGAARTIGRLV